MRAADILLAVAVILLAFCLRDALRTEGKLTPARTTWLRVVLIFAVVSAALQVLSAYLGGSP